MPSISRSKATLLVAALGAGMVSAECSFALPAYASDTCASLAADWAQELDRFIYWNKLDKNNCKLVVGQDYCIEWDGGDLPPVPGNQPTSSSAKPTSTVKTTSTVKSTSVTTTTTGPTRTPAPGEPTPVQDGITNKCNKWYQVKSEDTCDKIRNIYGFNIDAFYSWNPAVGTNCGGLWPDYYVCVGVPGATYTTAKPTQTPAPGQPDPVQEGITNKCTKWYKVQSEDTCDKIRAMYNFKLADFYNWNPAVGTECGGLWPDYYVCVSVPGATTTTPIVRPTNEPTPVQDGISNKCDQWYKVKSGDNCDKIRAIYNFKLTDFYNWNPAVGTSCGGLWPDYYVCVHIPGATITTPAPTPTKPPGQPDPVQSGINPNCKKYYKAVANDYCEKIAKANGITTANFIKWNPAVGGTACTGIWPNYYYCVGV